MSFDYKLLVDLALILNLKEALTGGKIGCTNEFCWNVSVADLQLTMELVAKSIHNLALLDI